MAATRRRGRKRRKQEGGVKLNCTRKVYYTLSPLHIFGDTFHTFRSFTAEETLSITPVRPSDRQSVSVPIPGNIPLFVPGRGFLFSDTGERRSHLCST